MNEAVPSVTKEDVLRFITEKSATVIDILGEDSYRKAHIRGAKSVPLDVLENEYWRKIPKNEKIVIYCKSYSCNASRNATLFLRSKGIDAYAYEGGILEWLMSGMPSDGYLVSRENSI